MTDRDITNVSSERGVCTLACIEDVFCVELWQYGVRSEIVYLAEFNRANPRAVALAEIVETDFEGLKEHLEEEARSAWMENIGPEV